MIAPPRKTTYTFDDFMTLVQDGEKADLIDGVIYMASPDNTDANDIFMWLSGLLYNFAQVKDLGKVYGSRVAFRLGDPHGPEPDIAFVRTDRLHLVQRGFVEGPPDLAVEIVSPDSVERDYKDKRELYRQAGVGEYWIIDEIERTTLFLRLDRGGRFREIKPRNGLFRSDVLAGFWLRPAWIWQNPLPLQTNVLAQILA